MEKTPHKNVFHKGINSDLDNTIVPSDLYRDAENCRVVEIGNGMVAATVNGTTHEFTLSEGFRVIGSTQYRGVLYLFSHNPITKEDEIGTYPSPLYFQEGYEDVYRPLQTFTFDNPSLLTQSCEPLFDRITTANFRIPMGFDLAYAFDPPIAREDFDGSTNLYWTDNLNPIRVVNTGFVTTTGLATGRFTSAGMVENGNINLLNESTRFPIIRQVSKSDGGSLLAGHYFFFVRYTDINYSATSFLSQSAPVAVFNTRDLNGVLIPFGGEPLSSTTQKVTLDIDNIDNVAMFLEIGYVYYYSETEYKASIIDHRYPINGNTNIAITITGNETLLPASIDELVIYKPADALFAQTMTQLNNILYLANTGGAELDHADLRRFCCALELQENATLKKSVSQAAYFDSTNPYGNDSLDVHEEVGYFSGETYVFSVVPVFKGGFVGRAFPVLGADNYTGTRTNFNRQGIFRFSSATQTPFYDGTNATIKGIQLDIPAAAQNIFATSPWLQANVIGLYLCRGKRIENLLWQGLGVHCYQGADFGSDARNWLNSRPSLSKSTTHYIPLMQTNLPAYRVYFEGAQSGGINVGVGAFSDDTSWLQADPITLIQRLGIFSLDHYVSKATAPAQGFVKRIAINNGIRPIVNGVGPGSSTGCFVPETGPNGDNRFAGWSIDSWAFTDTPGINTKLTNVLGWSSIVTDGFVSKRMEGDSTGDDGFVYLERDVPLHNQDEVVMNLPFATPDYVGFENSAITLGGWDSSLVNVYKTDPLAQNYTTLYDFKNTQFEPITSFIPTTHFHTPNQAKSIVAYQGDCFITRSWFKVLHAFEDSIGSQLIDLLATFNRQNAFASGWGVVASWVGEHAYNPNYRYAKLNSRNTFYPYAAEIGGIGKIGEFAWALDSPESNFYNAGYKRMLSSRKFLGIDTNEPITKNRFPTRIRPSIPHVFGAVRDGYRQFAGEYFDFDYKNGSILRLVAQLDWLISVQEHGINLHPINERGTTTTSTGDTIVTSSSAKLSGYRRLLSGDYGTQHPHSVVVGEAGLYGYDYYKQTLWRLQGESVQPLSLIKGCVKFVNFETSLLSSRNHVLANRHLLDDGIHGVFNPQFKELWLTFFKGDEHKTICFSEQLDNFMTRWTFVPRHFAVLQKNTFSFEDEKGWLHDSNSLQTFFYGTQHLWKLLFVANPSSDFQKVFDNLAIQSNNAIFDWIRYATQNQQALQNPFNATLLAFKPKYLIDQWKLAIRRADTAIASDLQRQRPSSPLRSKWLEMELAYGKNTALELASVLTYFNLHLNA